MSASALTPAGERCRLCFGTDKLVDVFDRKINGSKHLRQFILITSGVEILETDKVTKKVCHKCCIIAVKSYKYRYNAIENDKLLKKQCGQEYVPPSTAELVGATENSMLSGGDDVAAEQKDDKRASLKRRPSVGRDDYQNGDYSSAFRITNVTSLSNHSQSGTGKQNEQICPTNHLSVNQMLRTSRTIIVPKGVLQDNISPQIVLDRSDVGHYLRKIGKDLDEQKWHCLRQIELINEAEEKKRAEDEDRRKRFKYNYEERAVKVFDNNVAARSNSGGGGSSHVVARINFSDVSKIHALLPGLNSKNLNTANRAEYVPVQAQVSRKRTAPTTELLSEIAAARRRKIDNDHAYISSPLSPPPSSSPAPSDISSYNGTAAEEPEPESLLSATSKEELFECKICQMLFDERRRLTNHMKTHLRCKLCKQKFSTVELWEEHLTSDCYKNIAMNLPSIKLIKVDEIESMRRAYPNLKDAANYTPDVAEDDGNDGAVFEEVLVPTTNMDSNIVNEDLDVINLSDGGEDDLSLSMLLKSSMPMRSSVSPSLSPLQTSSGLRPQRAAKTNVKTYKIADDSDEETEMFSLAKRQFVLPRKIKPAVTPIPVTEVIESVSVIRPVLKIQLTLCPPTLYDMNTVQEDTLITALFSKYMTLITNKVTQSAQTDFLPDSSKVVFLGSMFSLQNMASELNSWKIPVVIKKNPKLSVSYAHHELNFKPKSKITIDWSDKHPVKVVHAEQGVRKITPNVPILPAPAKTSEQQQQPLALPFVTQAVIGGAAQNHHPHIPNLITIPSSTLYHPVPTQTFAIATSEPTPLSSQLVLQPSLLGQQLVLNSVNPTQSVAAAPTTTFLITTSAPPQTTLNGATINLTTDLPTNLNNGASATTTKAISSLPLLAPATNKPDTNNLGTNNLDINNLDTNNLDINNLATNNLATNNLVTNNLVTNNLVTNNLDTNSLDTNNLYTNNLDTNNLDTINLNTNNLDTNNLDTSQPDTNENSLMPPTPATLPKYPLLRVRTNLH